jgi:hypothetical protein
MLEIGLLLLIVWLYRTFVFREHIPGCPRGVIGHCWCDR